MRKILCALGLAALAALTCAAQEVSISASVDKQSVALDDQVVLTVSVSGTSTSLPDPRLPAMPNFNVHSAGRSQNISFINGAVSSSIQYTYVLVPRFAGKAVIGPISIDANGRQAQTQPMEIAVLRPSASSPGPAPAPNTNAAAPAPGNAAAPAPPTAARPQGSGPDLFVTAEVDKQRPYVNEQVILTVRFYTAIALLGNAEWVPPTANGFIIEDLPPGPHVQAAHQGRTYYVSDVKLALFPAHPGRLTIGPSSIRCQVQQSMDVDPFAPDFFQRFFSSGLMSAQTRELKTKPLTLEVLPLPEEGKPAGFSGAVGRYHIKAETDKREVKAGDAVNLTVTVEGAGNLKALGELALPEMKPFRVYDTVSSLNLNKGGDGVRGAKAYKTVIVPNVSGPLRIPPISFSYFDPQRKQYSRLQTGPIDLQVAPGALAAAAPSYQAPGSGRADITPMTEDIRYIKDRLREPLLSRLAGDATGLGWLHLVPLLIFLASLGFWAYRERLSRNPAAARFHGALPKAQGKVREAKALALSDPQRAAGLLYDALSGYLADKLDRPASGLTLKQIQQTLKARFPQLPDGHQERMKSLWEELEALRFAPSSGNGPNGDGAHLAEGLWELIQALEEDLR